MAEQKIYLHPYTISFDREGVHMLGETSQGDCGHTIGTSALPEFIEALHDLFIEHSTEGVVYWDQDEWDRTYGTTWD